MSNGLASFLVLATILGVPYLASEWNRKRKSSQWLHRGNPAMGPLSKTWVSNERMDYKRARQRHMQGTERSAKNLSGRARRDALIRYYKTHPDPEIASPTG